MGDRFYRDTWVEVDLDAICHNIREFRKHLPHETRIMAVVKADGYGHGAVPVAKAALEAGANYLGVAFLDEAIALRQAGINAPILILGYTPPEYVEEAIRHHIAVTAFHPEVILSLESAARELGRTASVHLKIDTGMGRIGVTTQEELEQLFAVANSCEHVQVEGIFTHFACADEEDSSYSEQQHDHFIKAIQPYQVPIVHCGNSAAGILYPKWGYNMVRIGISLYGQYPSANAKDKGIELRSAFSLKSKISHLKTLPPGSSISYGRTYTTTSNESLIATIPIGYADGFSRTLSNKGFALVKGTKVPIVGRICMDQLMLDVTAVLDPKIGEEVVLIGEQNGSSITVDDVAALLNTINYEVTCMISKRVPRVYKKAGRVVMTKNSLL